MEQLTLSLHSLDIGALRHEGRDQGCSFGAPKRKAPASAGGHGGERHDSARMSVRYIILSRLLQEKREHTLRAAMATQYGTGTCCVCM